MSTRELSEQEVLRRQSLEKLREMGINPYPAEEFKVTAYANEVLASFDDEAPRREVSMAGRIMMRRIMGKASFCELQDSTGRIQLYVTRDDIAPGEDKELYNTVFKKLLDIGDFIGIKGYVFRTKMGEVSIHVQELKLLSKSLRPLPVVKVKDGVTYDAFGDPEQRYRMRYVDLVVNPQVKEVFIKRSKTFKAMREFLDARGYLEVETPILQSIPGGAAARPFVTHHNALDIPLYLRIANELYLKRLIVGGFNGVYEFSKNFRNEGMDRTHNPEFTAMEVYVPYTDYNWMMEMTEQMLEYIAIQVNGTTKTKVGDRYVLERMKEIGASLGGEQSGHIIFLDENTTGDGLLSALHLLQVMVDTEKPLSELAKVMEVLPQALVNAKVANHKKEKYMEYPEIAAAIGKLEEKFAGEGRVLIRPSGTEPLVRVMIEGKDQQVIQEEARKLANLIQDIMF